MNKARIIITAIFCLAIAGSLLLPASQADTTKTSSKQVTFTKDVAPIFFKNCAECHRAGEAAPFSVMSYKDVRPWAKSIREKVVNREMPPWHADPHVQEFKNDRRMTQAEIDTITAWVDGGSQEGDPNDLPAAPKFVDGWRIGKPDLILSMPEEFTLEASGPDEYQYFEIPTNFTEDKYVQMAEARPGNRLIVHHIIAFVQPPPKDGKPAPKLTKEEMEKIREKMEKESILYRDGFLMRMKPDTPVYDDGCSLPSGGGGTRRDGSGPGDDSGMGQLLAGFAPGMNAAIWEPGTVKKIPAGSKIIFQMHYSKVAGSVQKDRSMVGLIFAKGPSEAQVVTRPISNTYFKVPPGADNHRVTACWTTKEDIHLINSMPHMHLRGKAMEIKAFYPDGRSEVLLNVPNYSFSWQTVYYYKKSIAIPKGTKFVVTAYFDNSTKNKYNPDPTQAVRFGEPTYDDMMIGWIDYTVDAKSPKNTTAQSSGSSSEK
ncbi:MAG TPA: cytochrome c [Blastocatellia bacterium]|jgi:mono/diheme cytochrome c family protein|nr:cytochrome c [Blastocatellia bacterium]